MTNDEAIESLPYGIAWIGVKGTPDNKRVAEMIANDHHVHCAHGETVSFIEANNAVENKYCFDDERGLEAACAELSDRLPFAVIPDNFEF